MLLRLGIKQYSLQTYQKNCAMTGQLRVWNSRHVTWNGACHPHGDCAVDFRENGNKTGPELLQNPAQPPVRAYYRAEGQENGSQPFRGTFWRLPPCLVARLWVDGPPARTETCCQLFMYLFIYLFICLFIYSSAG